MQPWIPKLITKILNLEPEISKVDKTKIDSENSKESCEVTLRRDWVLLSRQKLTFHLIIFSISQIQLNVIAEVE